MLIDLDARRAARAETQGDGHQVTVGGASFTLPPTCPLAVLDLMAEAKFQEAFAVLLDNAADARKLLADHRIDDADLEDLMSVYGAPGESSGSPSSSTATGSPSKPTSRRTTTSR